VRAASVAPVREALSSAIDALAAAGVEDPRLDAELLLGEAIGCERAALVADPAVEVPPPAARAFGEMVRRRLRREPVAYILGRKGFRKIELEVDRRVLVPRPETELLVELALELQPRSVLDVGTGSGAIALAVAEELPECAVTATDTCAGALSVARANAERLGLAERVRFAEGTLPEGDERTRFAEGTPPEGTERTRFVEGTPPAGDGRGGASQVGDSAGEFDLILANLPYVAERDWPALQPEVTRWEPREALLAGPDGLDAYRALIPECAGHFSRIPEEMTGALAVEVGEGQATAVAELMRAAGFGGIERRHDLAGIERVVLGRWMSPPEGSALPRDLERHSSAVAAETRSERMRSFSAAAEAQR
jgi:release factor glutamine methyltransferase